MKILRGSAHINSQPRDPNYGVLSIGGSGSGATVGTLWGSGLCNITKETNLGSGYSDPRFIWELK